MDTSGNILQLKSREEDYEPLLKVANFSGREVKLKNVPSEELNSERPCKI